MGVELFGEEENKLPVVTIVKVPEGISEQAVRQTMLNQFGIEIAGAFGPLKGKVWRIGSMGYSSRKNNILRVLSALESTLTYFGAKVNKGDAVQATLEYYAEADNPVIYKV